MGLGRGERMMLWCKSVNQDCSCGLLIKSLLMQPGRGPCQHTGSPAASWELASQVGQAIEAVHFSLVAVSLRSGETMPYLLVE